MSIYDYSLITIDGDQKTLKEFEGKVLLIVNTASKCGFTPQYKGLEKLYQEYGPDKFVVLGFPCDQFANQEPGTNDEIKGFCELNYGVTFPLFDKILVNGDNTHPLFTYLKTQKGGLLGKEIKWNFTKFLVDHRGHVIARYAPTVEPDSLKNKIEELISAI